MTTDAFLQVCVVIGLAILVLAFLVISVRIIVGPTLPDRVLALDMLAATAIGFIAIMAIKTRYFLYLDIAIALGLVGFLATVAFARFVLRRDKPDSEDLAQAQRKPHPPRATPISKAGKGAL
jgi:multicomponent Na+:H+ antiporter subunit F